MLIHSDPVDFVVLSWFPESLAAGRRIPPLLGIYANQVEEAIESLDDSPDVMEIVESIFTVQESNEQNETASVRISIALTRLKEILLASALSPLAWPSDRQGPLK